MELNADRLRTLLNYDPETGVFTWGERGRGRPVGRRAGTLNGLGYRQTTIDGVIYLEHRLAWMHVFGDWPTELLDHKNRIRCDNRIENLREATASSNAANTGALSVFRTPSGKWRSRVKKDGVLRHGGTFKCFGAALEASAALRNKMHFEGVRV